MDDGHAVQLVAMQRGQDTEHRPGGVAAHDGDRNVDRCGGVGLPHLEAQLDPLARPDRDTVDDEFVRRVNRHVRPFRSL